MDTYEESYILPELSLQITRTDSIASDATASNLPGPGRNIGLLYDAAGKKLEGFMDRLAGRYKPGPRDIAKAIRRIYDAHGRKRDSIWRDSGIWIHFEPTDKERLAIRRWCRTLLKYCRSHLLEAQLESLEAVQTLAIECEDARQVLADELHYSFFIPQYKEKELQIACSKALVSVTANEVYDVFSHFEDICEGLGCKEVPVDGPVFKSVMNRLESLLKNPDVSFLIPRLIQDRHDDFTLSHEIFRVYSRIAATHPQLIEWEALRWIFFEHFICHPYDLFEGHHIKRFALIFPILQLYNTVPEPCPSSIEAWRDSWCSDLIVAFLDNLCRSRKLETQLEYLRNLRNSDKVIWGRLKETVFANEILIAYAHVENSVCSRLDPTLLSCLQTAAYVWLCYYICSGDMDAQSLAKDAIIHSLSSSRYLKLALVSLVSGRDFKDRVDHLSLREIFATEPFEPYSEQHRSLDVLKRKQFSKNHEIEISREDMDEDDILYLPSNLHAWLEIRGDENPFDVTGHFPVLAGFDASGKELYVARVDLLRRQSKSSICCLSYVADGARSLKITGYGYQAVVFNRFYVLVLKLDPCDVIVPGIPLDAKFQMGPAFWIRNVEREGSYSWSGLSIARSYLWWISKSQDQSNTKDSMEVDDPDSNFSVNKQAGVSKDMVLLCLEDIVLEIYKLKRTTTKEKVDYGMLIARKDSLNNNERAQWSRILEGLSLLWEAHQHIGEQRIHQIFRRQGLTPEDQARIRILLAQEFKFIVKLQLDRSKKLRENK